MFKTQTASVTPQAVNQSVDQTMIDAVNMPLSKSKPQEDEESPTALKSRTQLLYGPDNALFAAAGVKRMAAAGVSTGLKPSSDTGETEREAFERRVAAGEISRGYTGPAGEVYRGPSGSDPAPTAKKGAFPWWLLPVGAAAGAGGVLAAQKIRGKKKVGPKVQYYPQQQPSSPVSPVVLLGGFLVIGLLGYAAFAASKK
jgi:hypothetical protein